MSLIEFYDNLNKFDWFFAFSDDHRVYTAGIKRRAELLSIARKNGTKYEEMFKAFSNHHFSGKPWNTEKQPKPERPLG
jgi:hypothetical protein